MKKRVLAIMLCLLMCISLLPTSVLAAPTGTDHITFSSSAPFNIKAAAKGWNDTVQYSTDNSTWKTWDGSEVSAASSSGTYYLCFRGTGNSKITGGYDYRWVLDATAGVACDGNIMTLLNHSNPGSASMAENCFHSLFYYWSRLTTAPTLPAMTLAPHCYDSLFYNCASLTTAPALPAMTMKDSCYSSMFYGCKNLTAAPALPATTLDRYCYSRMFYACTSLTTAPELPATTMAYGSYSEMFCGCTGLTAAPASLPATSLYRTCYSQMFSGCTSLTKAPTLPATTMADSCYEYMFENCTALTAAPALPATTLAYACYNSMFENCSSLKEAPALQASAVPNIAYQRMFAGCTGLTAVPALPATTLGDYCYKWMFLNCTGINLNTTNARGNGKTWSLPAGAVAKSGWNENMFMYTKGDLVAPELGTTYYYSDHDHSFVCENTDSQYLKSAADCTNAAVYYKSCECGKRSQWSTFTSGDPLGHSYGAWTYSSTEHQRTCAKDASHVETAEHSFNSSNVCTACGYNKTVATYTVTYEPNGGTGTMASETLEVDDPPFVTTYRFPKCGFTAPAGQVFDHWDWRYVSGETWIDTDPGSGPYLSNSIIVKAVWRAISIVQSGEGWYLDDIGCLHITGAVVNTSTDEWNGDNTPWKDYKDQIMTVVTETGASINNGNHLFSKCYKLVSTDLSKLNTTAATGMARMFENCYRMTSLNVSGFNTANVTNMASMFSNCSSLNSLDVSSFNTAKVENMNSMFSSCSKLTSLDLSGFNTAKATGTAGMFMYCSALTSLDIRNFQITWYTDISNMFIGCSALNEIRTNDSVLERTADALIDIYPNWANKNDGTVYSSIDALKAIEGTVTLVRTDAPAVMPGDVSGDGSVNDTDLTMLLRYVAKIEPSLTNSAAADMNNDGKIDAVDVTLLAKYLESIA